MKKLLLGIPSFVLAYISIGSLLDKVIFPEAEPGSDYHPGEGQVFVSKSEGFHQTMLSRGRRKRRDFYKFLGGLCALGG